MYNVLSFRFLLSAELTRSTLMSLPLLTKCKLSSLFCEEEKAKRTKLKRKRTNSLGLDLAIHFVSNLLIFNSSVTSTSHYLSQETLLLYKHYLHVMLACYVIRNTSMAPKGSYHNLLHCCCSLQFTPYLSLARPGSCSSPSELAPEILWLGSWC